ncbi:MAG: adenylate/guanylate cyclase domain-containing protein [Ignavibacteria bacterium]|nr:adenylate/guanylate cyclase domain-containing protein [Ignavibacteria bacterium]
MKIIKELRSFAIKLLISLIVSISLLQIGVVRDVIESAELSIYDLHFKLRFSNEAKEKIDDIIIVDIDEKSIKKLGRFSSWPLAYFGKIIDYVGKGGARSIAFDVFFSEHDGFSSAITDLYVSKISKSLKKDTSIIRKVIQNIETENQFAYDLKNSAITILACYDNFSEEKLNEVVLPKNLTKFDYSHLAFVPIFKKINNPVLPIPILINAANKIGFAHISPDDDGKIRYFDTFFKYKNYLLTNFSMQIVLNILKIDRINFSETELLLYSGRELKRSISIDGTGKTPLNFYGKKKKFRYISFSDVIRHRVDSSFFENKIVLIGASDIGLNDLKTTPVDVNYPGTELHATFVQNVLNNDYFKIFPKSFEYHLGFIIIIFSLLVFGRLRLTFTVLSYFVFIILALIGSFLAFETYNYLFNFSLVFYYITFSFLVSLIYRYKTEILEKKIIRKTFSKYVSSSIINEMLDHPEKLTMGGESKYVTALFSDIQNFTSYSEQSSPAELTEFLKKYMTELTAIVLNNKGMLDKYIGDSIVALWGVPMPLDGQAQHACFAALEMRKKAVEISKDGNSELLKSLHTRFGINTGKMIVGNMGSEQLFDYTGIGDNMNLASRLESLNKYYGTQILISEFTKNELNNLFMTREIDQVAVKGKDNSVKIYELIALNDEQLDQPTMDCLSLFTEGLALYKKFQFKEAATKFTEAKNIKSNDHPSFVYLKRCMHFIEFPPPKDWDGVFRMTIK